MPRVPPLLGTLAALALLFASAAHAAPFAPSASSLTLQVGPYPTIAIEGASGGVTDLGGPIREEALAFGTRTFDLADSLFTGVPSVTDLRVGIGDGAVENTNPEGLGAPAATRTFTTGFPTTGNAIGAELAGSFGGTAPLVGSVTVCLGCGTFPVQIPLALGGVGGTTGKIAAGKQAIFVRAGGAWSAGPVQVTLPSTTPGGTITEDGTTTVIDGRMHAGVTLSHDGASRTAAATTGVLKFGASFLATATPITQMETVLGSPVTVTSTTRMLTYTGFDERAAGGAGTVQLVTPIRVDWGPALTGSPLAVFAVQRLTFVPEPGTALLLGAGALALGALGRRRAR